MADNMWFFIVALGPILLGAIIAYALLKRRRLTRGEEVAREAAVERLYDKPAGGRETPANGR